MLRYYKISTILNQSKTIAQLFSLSNSGELRRDEVCATVNTEEDSGPRPKVRMLECQERGDDKEWILTEVGGFTVKPFVCFY